MAIIGLAMSNFFLTKDVFQTVIFARENGFEGIEIWADVPFCHPDLFGKKEREKLKKVLTENKLAYTLHGPMFGIDLGSINPGIRKESIRQTKAAIDLIKELDGKIVTIHPPKTPSRLPPVKEHIFQLAKEAISEMNQYGKEKGVTVILENCGVEFNDWEENLADFLRLVDECGVSVCLDIGHAHCSWRFSPEFTAGGLEKAQEALKEKIKVIHISDNHGKNDEHLPVGMGNISYQPVLSYLKNFSGMIVHEIQYPKDDEWATVESKKNLDKILSD